MIKIMINKLRKMLQEERFFRLVRYILIGGLTTLVSFGIYWVLYALVGIEPNLANTISVIVSVVFAYVTNKQFVFKSHCESIKDLIIEMVGFFSSRGVTMVVEIGGVFLFITYWKMDPMLSKVTVSILVIVLNYVFSQYLVFRNTRLKRKDV